MHATPRYDRIRCLRVAAGAGSAWHASDGSLAADQARGDAWSAVPKYLSISSVRKSVDEASDDVRRRSRDAGWRILSRYFEPRFDVDFRAHIYRHYCLSTTRRA